MSKDREFIHSFTETDVRRINDTLVTRDLITPDNYYIDLRLVKDLSVGATLLALNRFSEDERRSIYNKVYENIKEYQTREFESLDLLLKDTPVTEDEVRDILTNERFAGGLLKISPATGFVAMLDRHIHLNANHSQLKENFSKVKLNRTEYYKNWNPVTLHINHYPLKLSGVDQQIIAAFFVDRYGVNVKLHYLEPFTMTMSLFEKMDEVHLYLFHEFIESPDVHKNFKPLGYLEKHMFTTNLLPEERRKLIAPDSLFRERGTLHAYFNCSINFNYYPYQTYGARPEIFVAEPPVEETSNGG